MRGEGAMKIRVEIVDEDAEYILAASVRCLVARQIEEEARP